MHEHDNIQDVLNQLSQLAPTGADRPRPAREALAHLEQRLATESATKPSLLQQLRWRINLMSKQTLQRVALAGTLVALIALVFSFPAARAVASDLLGLFRVQKFAPISVSPEQLAQLEELELEGLYPGEFEMLEEPGEPRAVDSVEEAATATDMWVRTLNALGDPAEIAVMDGGHGRLTIDLESARQILEIAGIDPALLDDSLDGAEIDAVTSAAVVQQWDDADDTVLMQTISPEVTYPAGFNPADVGQAVLQLLGMEEDDAYRLAQNIDWTNTLVMPIPQEFATFSEVPVDSSVGLLIESVDGTHSMIMWQKGGIVYSLANAGNTEALLELAETL